MKFFLVLLLFSLVSLIHTTKDEPSSSSQVVTSEVIKIDKSWCSCRLKSSKRIVGGEEVEANFIPWQASLAYSDDGRHFCGATIINRNYILTAAHCVNKKKKKKIKVRVGLHNIFDIIPAENTYDVEKIDPHPYPKTFEAGDIAVLKLNRAIEFISGEVEPACLNFVEMEYTDKLMVSGWGTTTVTTHDELKDIVSIGKLSPVLKIAYLYAYTNNCKEYQICSKSNNGDSPCEGDSGGPLQYTKNGLTGVEGVLSHLYPKVEKITIYCSNLSFYSRLSYYKQWFEERIGENYCKIGDKSKRKMNILDDFNKNKKLKPN